MPKSRNRKEHKEKVKKFKTSKAMSQQNPQVQPDPVRQVPNWKSTETIDMNGLEFEAIFNFINNIQGAYGAVQSIMQRNILNGKVDLAFEKLNEDQTGYVPMTEEEQAPHKAELKQMIDSLKEQAGKMVRREDLHLEPTSGLVSEDQSNLPHIDALVDSNGQPLS